jgi:hypothetical protein
MALFIKHSFMIRYWILLLLSSSSLFVSAQNSVSDDWKELEKLEQLGRPQSALQLLDSILAWSESTSNYPYVVKAHLYREGLYNQFHQNPQQEYLNYLLDQYHKAPFPVRDIIAFPLAKTLLNVELDSGAGTSAAVDSALRLIKASLSNPKLLTIATADYAPIFESNTFNPKDYETYWQIDTSYSTDGSIRQPTLMDVLIKEAHEIFGHPLLNEESLDESYIQIAASFHQKQRDTIAWLFNLLTYGNKNLPDLLSLYQQFPRPEVLLKIGDYYWNHDESPKAVPIFERLIQDHKGTYEAAMAKKNLDQIRKPFFNIQIPEVITTEQSIAVKVTSKNIQQLYYQIYPMDISSWMSIKRESPNEMLQELPVRNPKLTLFPKDAQLPNPGPGAYLLILSDYPNPLSKHHSAEIKFSFFQISNLSFFQASRGNQKKLVIVNARNGQPAEGVTVEFFENTNYLIDGFTQRNPHTVLTSNGEGTITIPSSIPTRTVYRIIDGKDTLYHNDILINKYSQPSRKDTLTKSYIITDKAIYTPGSQVFFKIIHYQSVSNFPSETLSEVPLNVALLNTRGEVNALQKVITNEYGTATGHFTIPEKERSGNWTIKVEEGSSNRSFFVEEYTLPEIALTLSLLNESPKAGDTLLLEGQLKAFSGRNPSGAKVDISLVPQERWFKRQIPPSGNGGQPLWNTSVYTDERGQFKIAVPTDEAPGRFQIKAAAFTLSGSSCESQLPFVLGTQKWKPTVHIPKQVVAYQPFEVQLQLSNYLNRPGKAPYHFSIRSDANEGILYQEFGSLKDAQTFTVTIEDSIAGPLTAELLIYEEDGSSQSLVQPLLLIDRDFKYRDVAEGFLYHISSNHFQKGEELNLRLATDIPVYLIWESADGEMEATWLDVEQPVYQKTMKESNGVLHLIGSQGHQLYYYQEPIVVKQPDNHLILKYDQFTTTLIPGQKVKWDFSLTNPEGKAALAEVASVLYNKALDERGYQPWQFASTFQVDYPSLYISSGLFNSAQVIAWQNRKSKPIFYPAIVLPRLANYSRSFLGQTPLMMRSNMSSGIVEKTASISESTSEENVALDPLNQPNTIRNIGEEVVFFQPIITTSKKGQFSLEFDAPTTLSEWKLKILALDKELNSVAEEQIVTTFKPFFIDPYVPNFLRRGDTFNWNIPIANLTDDVIRGKAQLLLIEPKTKQLITAPLKDIHPREFSVETHSEVFVNWEMDLSQIAIEGLDFVMSASADIFEDRVQSHIPILTNQVKLSENWPVFLPPFHTDTISLDWKAPPEFHWVKQPLDWVWEVLPSFFEEEISNNTIQLINRRFAAVLAHEMGRGEYFDQISLIDEWLKDAQNNDGGFSWFPNGRSNPYISFYLLDLASRMKSQPLNKEVTKQALKYLNQSKLPPIYLAYINAQWENRKNTHELSIENWSGFPPVLKIMLGRYYQLTDQLEEAQAILTSLQETALGDFDSGIFWARESWGGALQLASDALLFFWEMEAERKWIQGLQMEVLKHKRLNGWGNSKSTALAISALWTTFSAIDFETTQDIRYEWKGMGEHEGLIVTNPNAFPAWGSIMQNYTKSIEEVEAYRQGPLKLNREYYVKTNEDWESITEMDNLKLGQTIKVVLNIYNESPMQTVVLRDEFPASAELSFAPSQYRWDRNITYYQTKDRDAVLFYFDDLPRGSHQVSYTYQLGRSGVFHTGISTIQSAYDDAFGSFDENMRWNIK